MMIVLVVSSCRYGTATNGGTGPDGLRNATVLDEVYGASYWDKNLAPRFGEFAKQGSDVQIWIGESATHGGGGTPGISNRFASLCKSQCIPTPRFPSTRLIDCPLNAVHVRLNPSPHHAFGVYAITDYYMSSLAATAAANHSGFLRQDLCGASYGLVEGCATRGRWEEYNLDTSTSRTPPGTCSPNPDWWGALLFRRLMGPAVMKVEAIDSDTLRAWGHCTPESEAGYGTNPGSSGDLTVLLLNLRNATQTVSLQGTTRAAVEVSSRNQLASRRTDYVLTPGSSSPYVRSPAELLSSNIVELNGQPLEMGGPDSDVVPPVSGVERHGSAAQLGTVERPPLAVAFVVLHEAASCEQ